ncbi:MAG: class I SAM-dependent methyltransferase [Verrucomicrobia bacterium]|nr:class I SAM-dependent methyltransferase [Verrucomicrobiota bacterium]MCH8526818.1 class I SAM-dependent methyltransferase [Kiritimatiellia bacterium]
MMQPSFQIPHGENLPLSEREKWFAEEREAYGRIRPSRGYPYHAANVRHGFRHLPEQTFAGVLAFGAGSGDELRPILPRIRHITLHESSSGMADTTELHGVPCTFSGARADGFLPFPDSSFDLITCLGVLHHIAKVSTVLEEFHRVLKPGGHALIREPIVSMGDTGKPRKGLTPRERGLPLPWLLEQVHRIGFMPQHQTCFQFLPFSIPCDFLNIQPYNSPVLTRLDETLCRIFPGSGRYKRTRLHHIFSPTSVFLVLKRPL